MLEEEFGIGEMELDNSLDQLFAGVMALAPINVEEKKKE